MIFKSCENNEVKKCPFTNINATNAEKKANYCSKP